MKILFLDSISKEYSASVKKLLLQCDKDFVPCLSSRSGVYQKNLSSKHFSLLPRSKRIDPYFNELCNQSVILAVKDGVVVGLLAYRLGYASDIVPIGKNIYVTTVVVSKDFRKRGFSRAMFESLIYKYPALDIYIRTWSTNKGQISLLSKLLFKKHVAIPNDRGNGVDTIYFCRKGWV